MSTTERSTMDADVASDVAARLRDAGFVRLFADARGDSLAASGVLARALDDLAIPFQASVVETTETYSSRLDRVDDETLVVALGTGTTDGEAVVVGGTDCPASVTAFDVARELGVTSDAVLALAGAVAAGETVGAGQTARLLDAIEDRGIERRPGVAMPVDDVVDGLAHSTLVNTPLSGDPATVQAALAELSLPAKLDADAHRRIASLVALDATDVDAAGREQAIDSIERALSPHALPDGPFATVEGFADVLAAVAATAPGTAIALALGHDARSDALTAWRTHGAAVHSALSEATTGRYDGLFVARVDDGPVRTTARLLRDFRSPEPVAMVVSDSEAGVAATGDEGVGTALSRAVADVGGESSGGPTRGYARFEGDTKAFIAAFREEL